MTWISSGSGYSAGCLPAAEESAKLTINSQQPLTKKRHEQPRASRQGRWGNDVSDPSSRWPESGRVVGVGALESQVGGSGVQRWCAFAVGKQLPLRRDALG